MNFLAIDDLLAVDEGEHIDPDSVISLEFQILKQVEASKKKWVVIIDTTGEPHFALDSDAFLRDALFKGKPVNPLRYCYRPIIVKNPREPLGNVLCQFKECTHCIRDDIIDRDVVLIWGGKEKRVITGADILGRLLKGI
ncbi:MAG: hypothetical protein V2J65_29760 [Desulfobacteraceae bacterium]|nr:hypothetical protein [Desulfobacteraceae bacterium]